MTDKISASNLIEERAKLLVRLQEIQRALKLLKSPLKPVAITTQKNLKNWMTSTTN